MINLLEDVILIIIKNIFIYNMLNIGYILIYLLHEIFIKFIFIVFILLV
jgi:hypothetical protein